MLFVNSSHKECFDEEVPVFSLFFSSTRNPPTHLKVYSGECRKSSTEAEVDKAEWETTMVAK